MLLRLLQWGYRMYQEGLHPSEYNQTLQSPYGTQVETNIKGRKKSIMDSRDIATVVSELNELLGDAERIQEEASTKADELIEIKEGLEEVNEKLAESVSALEGLEEMVETVENLLSDADNAGIN